MTNQRTWKHRMAEFGRGIYVHMVLLQLKQEHTEQSAQAASKVLQDRHSTTSGQPIPVFHHLRSIEVLPEIQSDPHVFHFSDIVPCFISGNTKKNPAPFSLLPPFRYLCWLIGSLLSCFFSRQYIPALLTFFQKKGAPSPLSAPLPFTGHSILCVFVTQILWSPELLNNRNYNIFS